MNRNQKGFHRVVIFRETFFNFASVFFETWTIDAKKQRATGHTGREFCPRVTQHKDEKVLV